MKRICIVPLLAACGSIQQDRISIESDRSQILVLRVAAGLSEEQTWEEVRLLCTDWWNEEAMRRFQAKGGNAMERVPGWEFRSSLWPEQLLYVRALMLKDGKSESDVMARLREEQPGWYYRWFRETEKHPELAKGAARLPPIERDNRPY